MIHDRQTHKASASIREAFMRSMLVALGLIASCCGAIAQESEFPTLRGAWAPPPPPVLGGWEGFYVGGQFGYTNAGVNFANGVNDLSSFLVRNSIFETIIGSFTTLGKASTNGGTYGFFGGYNWQWEGVMLGVEATYNRVSLNTGQADTTSVRIANDATAPAGHHFIYDPFTVSGFSTVHITDLASFRARAGWTIGQFLPYAFGGLAIARADVTRSATVSYTRTDVPDTTTPPTPPLPTATFGPFTQSDSNQGRFYYGYSLGLGLETCIMPHVLLRAEWEVNNFQSFHATVNIARAGIGVKF
jgi:outer membrane immunogenic protein